MKLITVKKSLNTGLTAQIGMSGQEGDEFLIVQFNTTMGIDFKEGLIDFLFADALEVKAQPSGVFLLHNSFTFCWFNIMQDRSCGCKDKAIGLFGQKHSNQHSAYNKIH